MNRHADIYCNAGLKHRISGFDLQFAVKERQQLEQHTSVAILLVCCLFQHQCQFYAQIYLSMNRVSTDAYCL